MNYIKLLFLIHLCKIIYQYEFKTSKAYRDFRCYSFHFS
jgi:hypothetical protein